MVTKDFLRQILAEDKQLLKMSEVKQVNIPKFDELSVKNLFPKFKEDADVMSYLPDRLPSGKLPDRTYFFNVLNTVRPEYVKEMVEHANKLRFKSG